MKKKYQEFSEINFMGIKGKHNKHSLNRLIRSIGFRLSNY